MRRRIAIATCDALLPTGDEGDEPLVRALGERGIDVQVWSWSDPDADWDGVAATVLRSTWDYTLRRAHFLRWVEQVPNLHNPADVVAANTDKTYLRGLLEAGLPVVPTTLVPPGDPLPLPDRGEFVVKPSVGAGSRGAGRFRADDAAGRAEALAHAHRLHAAGRTVLLQPYLDSVDEYGESALIFIDGVFSHAIRKGRMLGPGHAHPDDGAPLYIPENITPRTASRDERQVAERILAHLTPDGPLLYARIDLLAGPDGPVLVEAELTEPSLFLTTQAGERLAAAVQARIS